MSWEIVQNTAQAAWEVIKDGRPSAQIAQTRANAVPQVSDWQNLTHTHGTPNHYEWDLRLRNSWPFEARVVDIKFKLMWEFGARYNNAGAFIPNIWILVPHCDVLWGYTVNINLSVGNPSNHSTTPRAPIAQIPVTVAGSVSTLAQSAQYQWGFTLRGDGSSNTH